LKNTWKCYTA